MCGIVGYVGNKKISMLKLLGLAYNNKHRGEEDGVGIIYRKPDGKIKILKTTFPLKEMIANEVVSDSDKLKAVKKSLNIETDFCLIHHRKASVGDIKMDNVHPFRLEKGIHYVHNGTIYGTDLIKQFLSLNFGSKFSTDTDSEVLSHLIEMKMREEGVKLNEVIYYCYSLFGFGFGNLVRCDMTNSKIDIFCGGEREFFIKERKDGSGIMFISEPPPCLDFFTGEGKCYEIFDGHYQIDFSKKKKVVKVIASENTDKSISYFLYKNSYIKDFLTKTKTGVGTIMCDTCRDRKKLIKGIWLTDNEGVSVSQDICLSCFLRKELRDKRELKEDFIYDAEETVEDEEDVDVAAIRTENCGGEFSSCSGNVFDSGNGPKNKKKFDRTEKETQLNEQLALWGIKDIFNDKCRACLLVDKSGVNCVNCSIYKEDVPDAVKGFLDDTNEINKLFYGRSYLD